MKICKLAFEDGCVFTGGSFGAEGTACGEAVFNTAMGGYQEVLTDPSYLGQIVTMTYPLMGNYGVNTEDQESNRLYLSGFVIKESALQYSNQRASASLGDYLLQNKIIGLCGVDTRAIARRLRIHGSLRAVISTERLNNDQLVQKARSVPSMKGQNLTLKVAGHSAGNWPAKIETTKKYRVIALDCGIKHNILRQLNDRGIDVVAMSGLSSANTILEQKPQGILVGNGPGDPTAAQQSIAALRQLIGQVPIFGICLGHQLLACAMEAEIYKLKFGHHGCNHPVRNQATGRVEITSQNHGFAVTAESIERRGGRMTHINLNDRSVEGFVHLSEPLFAVQYHPEAAPGPHDSRYLFDLFLKMIQIGAIPEELIPLPDH